MPYRSVIETAKKLSGYSTPSKVDLLTGSAPDGTSSRSIVGNGVLTYGVTLIFLATENSSLINSDTVRNAGSIVPIGSTVTIVLNDDGSATATERTVSEPSWDEYQKPAQLKLKNAVTEKIYNATPVTGTTQLGVTATLIGDGKTKYGYAITIIDYDDSDNETITVEANDLIPVGVTVTITPDGNVSLLHNDLIDTLTHAENLALAVMMTIPVGTNTAGDGFNESVKGTEGMYEKKNENFQSVMKRRQALESEFDDFVRMAIQQYELMTPTINEVNSLADWTL